MSLDTDRIAISHELGSTADRFALEASRWREEATRTECLRIAGVLDTLSRAALTTGRLDVLEAYAYAGDLQLRTVIAARQLIKTINTPPESDADHDQP